MPDNSFSTCVCEGGGEGGGGEIRQQNARGVGRGARQQKDSRTGQVLRGVGFGLDRTLIVFQPSVCELCL
jgi:hypothetical protein